MIQCSKCGALNEDNAIYCNQCGYFMRNNNNFNSYKTYIDESHVPGETSIKIGYILSIIFGWFGVPLLLLSKSNGGISFMGFVGLFLPFYLIQSSDNKIKKHGIIQMGICLSGFIVQLLLLFLIFNR